MHGKRERVRTKPRLCPILRGSNSKCFNIFARSIMRNYRRTVLHTCNSCTRNYGIVRPAGPRSLSFYLKMRRGHGTTGLYGLPSTRKIVVMGWTNFFLLMLLLEFLDFGAFSSLILTFPYTAIEITAVHKKKLVKKSGDGFCRRERMCNELKSHPSQLSKERFVNPSAVSVVSALVTGNTILFSSMRYATTTSNGPKSNVNIKWCELISTAGAI